MRIDIVTIFPDICRLPLSESIMQRAQDKGILELHVHDLRDFTTDKHRKVDDEPYGGGQGMVMKPEPFFAAVEATRQPDIASEVILMTPQGQRFDQRLAESMAEVPDRQLIILCGHYEGVDHRVIEGLVDRELSIGDYVLTNGAIAAAIVTDAIVRLLPGVLGDDRSAWQESFSDGLLEAPHYTRPPVFQDRAVPEVLLSGHHEKINAWRTQAGKQRTAENRPDLLD
jgi:tRNA (guanine37-N1)-methyltransferase